MKAKLQKIFVIAQKKANFFAEKGRIKVFSWFYGVKELGKGRSVLVKFRK